MGQTCIAPDYLIIEESCKDAFIQLWKETAIQFKSPVDEGKIINDHHFNRLIQLFDNETIYAGGHYDQHRLYIEPTLVDGHHSHFMEEEIFGPILPIITYRSSNEIPAIIEKHPYPLALYLFSNDSHFIQWIHQRIAFGGGCINDCIDHIVSNKVPFGGIRSSGIGQYHGKDSFITFSHKQTLHYRYLKKDIVPLYPPYSAFLYKLVRKILK